MAALLNCTAFGCPDKIRDIIADNAAACSSGAELAANGMTWDKVAEELDTFNKANDELELGFTSPSAMPKYYKKYCK
jgi:hypothetical protein